MNRTDEHEHESVNRIDEHETVNRTDDVERDNQSTAKGDSKLVEGEAMALADNRNFNKPNHAIATARIFVDGLSVFGFNQNLGRAEFGFIRSHHEALTMEIYRNGCPNLFWSTENPDNFRHSTNNIMITINPTKAGRMGERFETMDFNPVDPEDFRFLPSLAKWHGQPLRVRENSRLRLSARLDIYDAVFYTYKKSQNDAKRHNIITDSPTTYTDLGKIGRIIGADIISSELDLSIEIRLPWGKILPVKLPNDGSKYSIIIKAKPHGAGAGHLGIIYNEILEKPGNVAFDVEFTPPQPNWYFCIVGDTRFGIYYTEYSKEFAEVPPENRIVFNSIKEAQMAGYSPAPNFTDRSTQFACESFEYGDGGLPDVP